MIYITPTNKYHKLVSEKALKEKLKLPEKEAKEIRKAMEIAVSYQDIDRILDLANKALNGFGVEAIRVNDTISYYYQDIGLLYVNRGDTYTETLTYDTKQDKFRIESFGNWIEAQKENYVI